MFFILLPGMLIAWKVVTASANVEYLLGKDEHDRIFTLLKLNNTDVSKNESTGPEMSNGTLTNLAMVNKYLLEFPPDLPRTLTSLDLSHNSLRGIEVQKILDLPELQILVLSHNAIKQPNWTGAVFNTLRRLDLSYNLLSSVPECHNMPHLQWLSLAGNPLHTISPLAFSCFPSLRFLDLSQSLLGFTTKGGIWDSAFAVKATDGIALNKMLNLTELDLSRNYLTHIQQEWTKDLPNLRKLTISHMPALKSLEIEAFKNMPLLKELICKWSRALSWTEPKIFEHTPQLEMLDFQNCNLSSFDRWHMNSSTNLRIILTGNPLKCSCDLSWLAFGTENFTLISANETTCNRIESRSPASLSLPELYKECQTIGNATVPATEYKSYTSTSYETSDKGTHTSTHAPITMQEGSILSTSYLTVPSIATTLQAHHNTMGDQNLSVSTGTSSALVSVPTVRTALSFEGASYVPTTISSSEMEPTKKNAITQANTIKKHTTVPHIPREYVADIDYEEEEEEQNTTPHKVTVCDYHPCRHLQKPCHEIQKVSMCYCPGLSADNVVPDPPRLRKVSEITDTSVQINWCAPNSVVQRYQLVYQQEGSENLTIIDNIYVTAREYTLYNLLPDTTYQACMITINKAGTSQEIPKLVSRIPCTKFKTRPSYIVILAALCITSGILLLAIIILSVCLYKQRKNTFVEKYDTHLVSYKNPAFDYSIKLQTLS
ncbi:leucine-rich repeat neuronal protein 4 [Lissotriton helveticus]